jgi:hypothetical protein
MGIRYEIDAAGRLVRLRYEGAPTFEEWAGVMLDVFQAPGYEPGFDFLADRRAVSAPTKEYLQQVVAFAQAHESRLAGSRWAMVVATPAGFGMARMGQVLLGDLPTTMRIFTDMAAAEAWLRRDAPPP